MVFYVRNVLVAIGTPSLALPVLFIAVCLMALWHYPRQISLGHVTVLQTQNFLLYEVSSGSYLYIPVAYVRNALVAARRHLHSLCSS